MLFDVMSGTRVLVGLVFLLSFLLHATASAAETLAVRYQEGVSHGFLVLRAQDGKAIADGDSTEEAPMFCRRARHSSGPWKQISTLPAAMSRFDTWR